MFCLPFFNFFKTIGELRKTIRELKSSLTYLRDIFVGLLRISQDIEDLTSEAKCLVEFYAKESRSTIREQLDGLMTSEANDELYYKDLLNYLQTIFSSEISQFLHEHEYKKQALSATIKILHDLRHKINNLRLLNSDISSKRNVLEKIDVFVCQLCHSIERNFNIIEQKENATLAKEEGLSIRLFCEQQKISDEFEQTLNYYFNISENDYSILKNPEQPKTFHKHQHKRKRGGGSGDSNTNEFIFRERTTRIRKLRHYLSSKIKLKKIGQYYREEVSLQIQLDLKNAAESLKEHEDIVHETIKEWIKSLRQLPKYHFKEIIDEEKIGEAKITVESLIENDFAFELENLVKGLNVGEKMNSIEQHIIRKGNNILMGIRDKNQMGGLLTALEKIGIHEDTVFPILQKVVRQNMMKHLNLNGPENNLTVFRDTQKLMLSQVTQTISSLPKDFHRLMKQNKTHLQDFVVDEIMSRNKSAGDVIHTILYLDRDAITGDVKKLMTPLFKMAVQASSRAVVFVIDKSFFATFGIVDTLTTVIGVVRDAGCIPDQEVENIFLGSLVKLMPNACHQDVRKMVYFCKAVHQRKSLRQRFLKEVENKLATTIYKNGVDFVGKKVEDRFINTIQDFVCGAK